MSTSFTLSCPLPVTQHKTIVLGHGSGGRLTAQLVRDLFLPAFDNPALRKLDDQAVLNVAPGRIALTTDSYVVTPLFFPGGDIGRLAVNGTVNDLAMSGARPLYLTAAFIIEEGLPIEDLQRVTQSMSQAAAEAGVAIVTGDTKVVNRGCADKLFITTAGVGLVPDGISISASNAQSRRCSDCQRPDRRSRNHDLVHARRHRLRGRPEVRHRSAACSGGSDDRGGGRPRSSRPHARRSRHVSVRDRGVVLDGHRVGRERGAGARGGEGRLRDPRDGSAVCRQRGPARRHGRGIECGERYFGQCAAFRRDGMPAGSGAWSRNTRAWCW